MKHSREYSKHFTYGRHETALMECMKITIKVHYALQLIVFYMLFLGIYFNLDFVKNSFYVSYKFVLWFHIKKL